MQKRYRTVNDFIGPCRIPHTHKSDLPSVQDVITTKSDASGADAGGFGRHTHNWSIGTYFFLLTYQCRGDRGKVSTAHSAYTARFYFKVPVVKNYASSQHVSKCLIKCNLLPIKDTYSNKKISPNFRHLGIFFFLKNIPIKHTLKVLALHKRLHWQPPLPQSTSLGKIKKLLRYS